MKLYSQMGVSSSRNSPYFLYKSYVTWTVWLLIRVEESRADSPCLVAPAVVPDVLAHHHHRGVSLELLQRNRLSA